MNPSSRGNAVVTIHSLLLQGSGTSEGAIYDRAMEDATMRRAASEARIARLGTVGADGRPHLVPFCFVIRGDTLYSAVDGKPKSTLALRRLANVVKDPRVTVLIDHYSEDWLTLWWVRIDGACRVLTDNSAERSEALALLARKYRQYDTVVLDGPVLAVDIGHWVAWP